MFSPNHCRQLTGAPGHETCSHLDEEWVSASELYNRHNLVRYPSALCAVEVGSTVSEDSIIHTIQNCRDGLGGTGYNRSNHALRKVTPWEVYPDINTVFKNGCFQRRGGALEVIDAVMVLEGFLYRFQVLILDDDAILCDAGKVSQSASY